jgi:23S rRNA pseudouridine955/2504/2580 synthase
LQGGRPDDVPRPAAFAGSDVRPRQVMIVLLRPGVPSRPADSGQTSIPNGTMARFRLHPVRERQADSSSAQRTGAGSPVWGESLRDARQSYHHEGIFPMAAGTSAPDFMAVRVIEVGPERDGQRLDNSLVALLKGVPKGLIYRLLRTGQVRVNGRRAKPDTRLAAGDRLRIPPVRTAAAGEPKEPPAAMLEVVQRAVFFEDRDFLAIDKPPGIASHGGSGVAFGAIELLRAARSGEHLELAHRLDRDTSGVLVFARSRRGLTGLQALIRDGATRKQYLCLMTGKLARAKFDVNAPLRKSVLTGGERLVRVDGEGKPALTFFREIERYRDASLVEATLATGRTHQIRVHAAHAGYPLAGDPKYGDREANRHFRESGLKRLFLHAARFEFELGERAYSFSAPLPDDLRAVLDRLQEAKAS